MAGQQDADPGGPDARARWVSDAATVLEVVRRGGARYRTEIVERTGLHRGVASRRAADLIARGLLRETMSGPSTGGRPPRELVFAADAGHYLVADLGATSIDVALTDLDGRVLAHESRDASIATGPDPVLEIVDRMFASVTARCRREALTPWGIGIGVPGPVEFDTGHVVAPPIMPGWDGYPIRERFTAAYGCPSWVDNDVNIMALGEWRLGAAKDRDDVVFVKVGTGIGAGIISDGRLHRGAQGGAGDIGHIRVTDDHETVCRCGNVGCLEAVAGGGALALAAQRAVSAGTSPQLEAMLAVHRTLTAEDVGRAAAHGDAVSIALLQEAGRTIGQTLAGVVNVLNPSLIVIGGGVARSGDHLLAAIRETIYGRSLPMATRDLAIVPSALDSMAGVIGAASMVGDELFRHSRLTQWVAAGRPSGPRVAAR